MSESPLFLVRDDNHRIEWVRHVDGKFQVDELDPVKAIHLGQDLIQYGLRHILRRLK